MKRTTITLPDDLHAAAEREARRRGISVSEVAREALEQRLGNAEQDKKLPFIALGRSRHRHTARDAETILAEEWGDAARDR